MTEAGFDAVAVEADISSRKSILNMIAAAQKYGEIAMLINAAGVSPSQASIETILKVDLYGTAKGMGAAKVMITDISDLRLAKAKECGIGVTFDASTAKYSDAVPVV